MEAEKALLGALLINPAHIDRVSPIVSPETFFRRAHQAIYASMLHLAHERKVSIDPVTLRDELVRRGDMDEVGGPAYIAALADGSLRSANAVYYAGIVKEKAALRSIITTANQMLADAYDASQDATAIVNAADHAIVDLQRGSSVGRMVDLRESAAGLFAVIEHHVAHRGELLGIPTGFASIDELTSGWQRGDMIVIAARPSIGKTLLALNMALHAALSGHRVAVFSLEMRRRQLEYRLLSRLSGVALSRVTSGYLSDDDFSRLGEATGRLSECAIFIEDRGYQTIRDIRAWCRRLRAEGGLDLVVVDYVQLVAGSLDRRGANRQEEVTDISRRLKVLADEVQAPVIVLSQLNRAGESRPDKRPVLSDLRESGCVPATTRVLMADTGDEITVEELVLSQAQPWVWSVGSDLKLVPAKVRKTFSTGIREVYLVTLKSGLSVEATAGHPFLGSTGWVNLEKLTDGLMVAAVRSLPRCDDKQWTDVKDIPTPAVFWDEVVSVNSVGTKPVFDIEVDTTHNFVGNGIVLHNSLEQDTDLVCFAHRKHHRESGTTQFIIEKQRNGPTGTVNITVTRETQTAVDGGDDPPDPPKPEKAARPPRAWTKGRS